jgi:predicted transcriptional regulator
MLRDGGGEPHKTKVGRTLDRLAADRLVEKYRGRYRLTKLGKREAEGVD